MQQRFARTATQFYFDRRLEPVGTVRAGEQFVIETQDSLCGLIKTQADVVQSFHEVLERLGGVNPVTGPIYVDGCRRGDYLSITIEDIAPSPRDGHGWTAVIPGWGGLSHDTYGIQDPLRPLASIARVTRDAIELSIESHQIQLPCQPFIGTFGVAPAEERRMTLSQSPEYVGDVDVRALSAGTTLIVRSNVDGGLLSIGDVHATQGDAEITGVAVEVEADVTLRVDVIPAGSIPYGRLPVVETAGRVGVVAAFGGVPLASCIRAGYADLCGRLHKTAGFSREGAYTLLGQVGRVQVGNMIDPFYSCVVSVDRAYIA